MEHLPSVISQYFARDDARDIDSIVDCFTDDAVVMDEGQTMRGKAELRRWRERVARDYEYTVDILDATSAGNTGGTARYVVGANLKGNFPGGTVDLTFRFGVRDGRVAELLITP